MVNENANSEEEIAVNLDGSFQTFLVQQTRSISKLFIIFIHIINNSEN